STERDGIGCRTLYTKTNGPCHCSGRFGVARGLSGSGACRGVGRGASCGMSKISYRGFRFPPQIIQYAVWLYFRFTLSLRDVEDLLAERGIEVSYETIRQW